MSTTSLLLNLFLSRPVNALGMPCMSPCSAACCEALSRVADAHSVEPPLPVRHVPHLLAAE